MTAVAVPAPLMSENHTRTLLAVLVSLDPRLKASDEVTAEVRVSAWTNLLGEVEPGYAMRYAQHAYQQVRDWPLQPAEILQAWRTDAARAQHTQDVTEDRAVAEDRRVDHTEGLRYMRTVWEAWRNGATLAEVEAIPLPQGAALSPSQDARERRCRFHQLCTCDHSRCRDGWLDAEVVIIGTNGRQYAAVQPCSWCRDALLMAEEQGRAQTPGKHQGRRR